MRIGHGYDVHKFADGRKLIIGGVNIPCEQGLDGHSDADVLVHAVMDALLGAAALGDIGYHFPDSDDEYLGINSLLLLEKVVQLVARAGWSVGNIDATVIAEKPRLSPYIGQMRENIARVCKIPVAQVNVKATTEEGLGLAGRGIAAHSVCLLDGFGLDI